MYTSLINIDTGEFYWRDKELNAASNCIAKDNKLFYVDKSFNIVVMEIESGNMIMEENTLIKSGIHPFILNLSSTEIESLHLLKKMQSGLI